MPNKVIRYLILSDLVLNTGWGLFAPLFAIFVLQRVEGGTAFVVGTAAAVFWLSRSLLRIPISIILDALPTEKDDYLVLVFGSFMVAFVAFGYIWAKFTWHIYCLQALQGLGEAMLYAGYTAIFTRHIDKGKESTAWGLNATSVGLGIGFAGIVGGWTVTKFGFVPVLIAVGSLNIVGALLRFGLRNEIKGVFDHGLSFSVRDIFHREEPSP